MSRLFRNWSRRLFCVISTFFEKNKKIFKNGVTNRLSQWVIVRGLIPSNRKRPFHRPLKTEYHFFKYVTCVSRNAKLPQRYATTSFQERALIPSVSIGLLPIWRRPTQAIMILLYGAGGEPGRGEIPMSLIAVRRLKNFPYRFIYPLGCRGQISGKVT